MNRKLRSLKELKKIVLKLKDKGQKIVFANGCFDLLHVGHVRYLKEAKKLGDKLIVGINSDDSVRKIKGKGRPLISEKERAEIVSELESVDYLLIFSENNAEKVLKELKPHIQAKGTDYSQDSVPERGVVLAYGGKIAIVGDPKERSSTDYLARLFF